MNPNHILVVDDEAGIRELLLEVLQDEGYEVRLAENASAARLMRSQSRPDLVLLDIWMPDSDGITLLKEWASSGMLTMPVVMMSGHGTIDTAVEATKIGAFDFLEKPITLQKLLKTVGRALKKMDGHQANGSALLELGKSPVIEDLKKRLLQISASKNPVLLVAEEGAGAEICARFLCPAPAPWVTLENEAQLERPLHILEACRGGVFFIENVALLPKIAQKALHWLLPKLTKQNARLICTATGKPRDLVDSGVFDAALYEALCGFTINIPSLREHAEDIPFLAAATLSQLAQRQEVASKRFHPAALNALQNETWPGNVRQLRAVVKTLALTSPAEELTEEDVQRVLGLSSRAAPAPTHANAALPLDLPLREARDVFERIYFEHHIAKAASNMSKVAEKVGLERTHLYRKLKQLGIRTKKLD
mgnify:CR=1 FL=1